MEQDKASIDNAEFKARMAGDLAEIARRFATFDGAYISGMILFHNIYKIAEVRGAVDILMSGVMKINEMISGSPDGGKGKVGHA